MKKYYLLSSLIFAGFIFLFNPCQLIAQESPQTYNFTTSGTAQSLTIPEGVTSIDVKAWAGGGGAGGAYQVGNSWDAGGGGGGGGFAGGTFSVSENDEVSIVVGYAGYGAYVNLNNSQNGGNTTVSVNGNVITAIGGSRGLRANTGGSGGSGGGGSFTGTVTNQVTHTGGTGGNGGEEIGGGGGGGAGDSNDGGDASNGTAGSGGISNGGNGGTGGNNDGASSDGENYGGGGGAGGDQYNGQSGSGANGYVIISWTALSAPTITNFSPVSACAGSGTTVTINGTSFVNGATTVTFNGTAATVVTFISTTQITADLPDGATTGPIAVTTPGGTATSAGNFTVTDNNWTGAVDTDWATAGNWCGGVPTSSIDALIPSGLTNYPIISTGTDATCNDLTIQSGATLTIASTSASATGSLDVNGSTSISGTINVQRWIPDDLAGDDWHIISSPVGGIDMHTWATSTDGEVEPGTGDYDLAPYTEQVSGETYGQWGPYISGTGTNFAFGRGYAMRRVLNPTNNYITFSGSSIQTGNLTGVGIPYNGNGWNALGNPFLSAIDIGTFLSNNSGQIYSAPYNKAYLWDPTTSDYSGTTSGNVALGQGFMVKSKGGGGSISFTTAMQTTGGATFKSAEIPLPSLQLIAASNKLLNRTKVLFSPEADNGLDNLDIGKFSGNPDISLYTKMPDDASFDLQDQALAIPEENVESIRIPVGFDFAPGGDVTFTLTTEGFPDDVADIYLEDVSKGTLTLLNGEDLSYTTDVAAGTKGTGRFFLVAKKSGTTDAKVFTAQDEFRIYTRDKEIVINGPADANTRFELYSIEGRQWYSNRAVSGNVNRINGAAFPAGMYLLRISKTGAVQTEKVVLPGN